jgi:hypothetical protein
MENLIINNDPISRIRKGLGIFTILIGIIWVFVFLDSKEIFDLTQSVLWTILGVYHLTDGFGLEKSFIEIVDTGLMIKLTNKVKPVMISDSEIENICLKKSEIVINRVNKKPFRFKRNYLELKQMTEVYQFFIEYSDSKNITLIRQF